MISKRHAILIFICTHAFFSCLNPAPLNELKEKLRHVATALGDEHTGLKGKLTLLAKRLAELKHRLLGLTHERLPTIPIAPAPSTLVMINEPKQDNNNIINFLPSYTITQYKPIKFHANQAASVRAWIHKIQDNTKNIDLKTLPNFLKKFFPELSSDFVINLVQHLVTTINIKGNDSPIGIKDAPQLTSEGCSDFLLPERIFLTIKQLNDIARFYPDKNQPIIHASLACGGLVQTYTLAYGLRALGYQKVHFILIDPTTKPEAIKALKEIINQNNPNLPKITFTCEYFEYANDFIGQNRQICMSYDLIDLGDGTGNPVNIIEAHKNARLYNFLELRDDARNIAMRIYIIPEELLIYVGLNETLLTQDQITKIKDILTSLLPPLQGKTITEIADSLTSNELFKEAIHIQNFDDKNILRIGSYVWIDFYKLVQATKVKGPPIIIYEGIGCDGDPQHGKHNIVNHPDGNYNDYVARMFYTHYFANNVKFTLYQITSPPQLNPHQ